MDKSVDELLAELAAAPLLDPPELVSRRWHRALAELPPPSATPAPRHRRPTPRRLAVALATASAAALVLTVQSAGPIPLAPPLPTTALAHPNQAPDLADPARRAGCLARLGLPSATVLSTRPVNWHGQQAIQLTLTTPTPGQLRTITTTPNCDHLLGPVPH